MVSADLRAELECPVCLSIYTDAVMLRCGHNFCRVCIDRVLDTQEGSGRYSCPECREEFQERPALQRNITLCNIVENFLSAQPGQEESGVLCTYCIHAPVPAVKYCLHCEASLCDNHLRVHSKSPEHVLSDPTTSLKNRKCSIHKKILEYYCTEDSACICLSCCLIGEHKGHQMESLEEASEKRKEKLKNVLQKLMTDKEKMDKRVNSLQESKKKAEEQATSETRRTTELFIELRRKLEDLEKKVLSEISGEAKRIARSANRQIHQLQTKKDEIYGKMRHIEELCNMTDPLTVLQDLNMGDLCHTEDGDNKNREEHDKLIYGGGDLDVFKISHTLHTGLSDMRTCVERGKYIPEPADILLDPNTAHINVNISGDRKVASWSDNKQIQKVMAGRFQDYAQVMSSQSFSLGRHYWDVDLQGSHRWRVGVCYPSMDRTGENSLIGNNNKSWGIGVYCNIFKLFSMHNKKCFVVHNSKEIPLPAYTSTKRVRIYLDYEAGKISFYDVCDPIHLLYTFTATFTEPLHAVFSGCVKLSGK